MLTNTAKSRPRSNRLTPLQNRQVRLLQLYNLLLKHFGPRKWWPAEQSWEMMVGAILTQNTAWTNVKLALESLKKAKALTIERIARMPRRQLERLIQSSGFFRQKAERLQQFARYLLKHPDFHQSLLGKNANIPLPALRDRLLSLKGIGPETADCMLLYAGGYPSFVVDAYTRRIGQRQGLFTFDDYHQVQRFFDEAIPQKAPMYNEFHALIVNLAKDFCRKRDPRCESCPVREECQYALHRKMIHAG
jgi:endonuclease-3 related protein